MIKQNKSKTVRLYSHYKFMVQIRIISSEDMISSTVLRTSSLKFTQEQTNRFTVFSLVYKSSLIYSCLIVSEEFTNQNIVNRILAYDCIRSKKE